MIALLCFFLTLSASPLKSRSRLEAENAALRHQLIVLQRSKVFHIEQTDCRGFAQTSHFGRAGVRESANV
jgi:hypothetical protein